MLARVQLPRVLGAGRGLSPEANTGLFPLTSGQRRLTNTENTMTVFEFVFLSTAIARLLAAIAEVLKRKRRR